MKKQWIIETILFCFLLMSVSACGKKQENNLVFNKIRTIGVVNSVEADKLTITVSEDDSNFKKGDSAVIVFKSLYLNAAENETDFLEKIDSVSEGDTVYAVYSEEERNENTIRVEYAVKEEK